MTQYKNSHRALSYLDIPVPQSGKRKKRVYDRVERSVLGLPPLEDDVQEDVFEECKYIKYGSLTVADYFHHSPNGGKRKSSEAARFKKIGTKSGFPDIFIFITNSIFRGLFIEVKSGRNTSTDEQTAIHKLLEEQGYKVVECNGRQATINAIKDYLKIK